MLPSCPVQGCPVAAEPGRAPGGTSALCRALGQPEDAAQSHSTRPQAHRAQCEGCRALRPAPRCRDPSNQARWAASVEGSPGTDLDTFSFLGCCDLSPCSSHPWLQAPCGEPIVRWGWMERAHHGCSAASMSRELSPGAWPYLEGTSASRALALGCCWRTPRSKTSGLRELYLQLGKVSFPWLQSLAPFLPCLQTERISPRSSLDLHPTWPQEEGLRAKRSSHRGEVR